MEYGEFLSRKMQLAGDFGFAPTFLPDALKDFQKHLVEWSVRRGRAATLASPGFGKTLMQLVWAENVVRHTNRPVLILAPLAVVPQTVAEAAKFGIEAHRSNDGKVAGKIVVTNYDKLHLFNPADFAAVACDESGCIKNFDGARTAAITEFMRTLPYRGLYTATPAPNDYVELGTSSEALGELGYMDMLNKFFKNDQNSNHPNRNFAGGEWRFRGHAETDFWRWVCSWARAVRMPSDLGFDDAEFILPELVQHEHVVKSNVLRPGYLMEVPAVGLREQREERRRTMQERCEMAASLINATTEPAVAWCHLNPEGDLLEKLIPGAVQVAGADSDEVKEEAFAAFAAGQIRVLVTKPILAGFGLNWQHCAHQTFFPSHSFEQYFQAVRRSWRFGQKRPVRVDVITSEGEVGVLANLQRKAANAEAMFARLVAQMNDQLIITKRNDFKTKEARPSWLSSHKG